MMLFVGAAVSIYLVLKIGQLLTRRDLGYRQADVVTVGRKRIRELIVVVASIGLGALITIYHDWWIHRLASREYAHSRICYAQMETAFRLRTLPTKFDLLELERSAISYRGVAERHGAMLGISKASVDTDLAQQKVVFWDRYSGMNANRDGRQLTDFFADVTRCLNDDWAPHGEILNP